MFSFSVVWASIVGVVKFRVVVSGHLGLVAAVVDAGAVCQPCALCSQAQHLLRAVFSFPIWSATRIACELPCNTCTGVALPCSTLLVGVCFEIEAHALCGQRLV